VRARESLPISLGPPACRRPRQNGQVLYNGWYYCEGPSDFLGVDTAVPMCLPHLLCFLSLQDMITRPLRLPQRVQ
jgi:hypothetical protein